MPREEVVKLGLANLLGDDDLGDLRGAELQGLERIADGTAGGTSGIFRKQVLIESAVLKGHKKACDCDKGWERRCPTHRLEICLYKDKAIGYVSLWKEAR